MKQFNRLLYRDIVEKRYIIGLTLLFIIIFFICEESAENYLCLKNSQAVYKASIYGSLYHESWVDGYVLYAGHFRITPPFVQPANDELTSGFTKRGQSKYGEAYVKYDKEVFLTFDDGPSKQNTPAIIDILKKYNIKATFFVVGNVAEMQKDILKQLQSSGMCILPHSYTHQYNIYSSQEAYFNDLNKCIEVIQNLTEGSVPPYIRMPGGSASSKGKPSILETIRHSLRDRSIGYVDWNVNSTDAVNVSVNPSDIISNVENQCKGKNVIVLLMHDSPTKKTTVEALPGIINYLKSRGYVFRTFKDISPQEEYDLMKKKIINR